jgi:hypothetical protein
MSSQQRCHSCDRVLAADGRCAECVAGGSSVSGGGSRSAASSFSFSIPTLVNQGQAPSAMPPPPPTSPPDAYVAAPQQATSSKPGSNKTAVVAISIAVVSVVGLVAVLVGRSSASKAAAPAPSTTRAPAPPATQAPSSPVTQAPVSSVPTTASTVASTGPTPTSPPSAPTGQLLGPSDVVATCESAPATDSRNNPVSYEPWRAADGKTDTAWRCDGDSSGQSITLSFGREVTITQIGLLPGYAKVDPYNGINRFPEMRRVRSAQFDCIGDGESVRGSVTHLFRDAAQIQNVATPGLTACSAIRVIVVATLPPGGTNDYTPISEIVVLGIPT